MTLLKKSRMFLLLFLLILIVIFFMLLMNTTQQHSTEIVVARYNEDLKWLCDPQIVRSLLHPEGRVEVFIYNKGKTDVDLERIRKCLPNVRFHVKKLPNVGREGHTYLHHICSRRDELADVTVFLPGSSNSDVKFGRVVSTLDRAMKSRNTVFIGKTDRFPDVFDAFQLDDYHSTNALNFHENPEVQLLHAHKRPYGEWFMNVFPNREMHAVWGYNSIFAVHRDHVLQHPPSYYTRLLRLLASHHNPEAGHYMERSWGVVFSPLPDACIYDD